MKRISGLLGAAIMAVAFSTGAYAQEQCDNDKIIIGTGTASGTYGQMFPSLAAKCSMVCETRKTQGGLDNITQIIKKQFDGGIVQVDTLDLVNRTTPTVKQNVRSLFALHGSSLHIFAMKRGWTVEVAEPGKFYGTNVVKRTTFINTLQDLKGLPVAAWSSAFGTAQILDERLRLNLDIREYTDRKKALADLANGTVAAMMGMGGYPLDWVERPDGSGGEVTKDMVMVNASSDDISRAAAPYYNQKALYRSIDALGINMITVRNELVVWNIQTGPRARAVADFQACFKANLDEIKDARGSHAAWQDVSLETPLYWEPYKPANAPAVGGFVGPLQNPLQVQGYDGSGNRRR